MTYSPRRPPGRRGLLSDSRQPVGHFLSFEGRDDPPPCILYFARHTVEIQAVAQFQLNLHITEQSESAAYYEIDSTDDVFGKLYRVWGGEYITHIRHAYACLAPGGRLVAIAPRGFDNKRGRVFQQFTDWLGGQSRITKLPDDGFKDSDVPCGIQTCMIVMDKY